MAWISVGSESSLTAYDGSCSSMETLRNQEVILFPDLGADDSWKTKMEMLRKPWPKRALHLALLPPNFFLDNTFRLSHFFSSEGFHSKDKNALQTHQSLSSTAWFTFFLKLDVFDWDACDWLIMASNPHIYRTKMISPTANMSVFIADLFSRSHEFDWAPPRVTK